MSEELHESDAAPYSDASCVDVFLASTSLMWSDQTVPRLRPLCMLLHICWMGVLSSNKWPFAIPFSENGGWAYFQGWAYFREATVQVKLGLQVLAHLCIQNTVEDVWITEGGFIINSVFPLHQHNNKYVIIGIF